MRKPGKYEPYKALLKYTCANPACSSGLNIHVHHIRPLMRGGEEAFWNVMCLCRRCHQGLDLHGNDYEDHLAEMYTWKCMHELDVLGFVCDEKDDSFFKLYNDALEAMNKKSVPGVE